jgi:hypothetical protein
MPNREIRLDPEQLPHKLIEHVAMAMMVANNAAFYWGSTPENERNHWRHLAKISLVALSNYEDLPAISQASLR